MGTGRPAVAARRGVRVRPRDMRSVAAL